MSEDSRPGSHPIRILSYNMWHGRAQRELASLVDAHHPDVVCVQEAHEASLPKHLGQLHMAIATPRNRLGVALYVRTARFAVESAAAFQLSTTRHDRLVGGTAHRLAAARVTDLDAQRSIVLASFHATPFTDSNAARRRQIDEAHAALEKLGPALPSAMAGDYNHPILLFMLRHHLKRRGHSVASTASSTFYKEGNIMRGKFDLATVSQLDIVEARTFPHGASDHKPVLFVLDYMR